MSLITIFGTLSFPIVVPVDRDIGGAIDILRLSAV